MHIPEGQLKHLLDPLLRKVFFDQYKRFPSLRGVFYNEQASKQAREREFAMGSLGTVPEFKGTLEYDTFEGLWAKDFVHVEYATGMSITRRMIEDDLYRQIVKIPKLMATSLAYTQETHAVSVFNNAFSTSYTGPDGAALCSASHPYSPTDSTTQDNTDTAALSQSALVAARLAMQKWYDDRGKKMVVNPRWLLVPPDLEETAYIVTGTERVPVSQNWDKNIVNTWNFRIITWPFLSSTTAWFLIDPELMRDNLLWFNRIPVETDSDEDFDTRSLKWRIYTRYSYGFYDWRWVYGSTGAG